MAGNIYDDYPQLRTIFKPGRNVSKAQFEADLLESNIPYSAFTKYPELAKAYPNVASAIKTRDAERRAAFNRIFNQPYANAPKRGTAVSDYGGVYFGVPGLSPSSMPVPQGGWEAYQRNVSQTPGAGLMAIGIDPRDPQAEAKARAWLDFNRQQGTGLWQEGAWGTSYGRQDARMPGYQALVKKNLSAMDIADTLLRGHYGQSALPTRGFDIGDFLIPAGEILLGAVTGAPWASMALGGGYGAANNGLVGGIFGAAAGAGAGGFGADWATQGLGGAISNQIPDISNVFSGGPSISMPTTASGIASSAADVINAIPSQFVPSDNTNRGIASVLPTAAFGAQAAGAFKPSTQTTPRPTTPTAPVTSITPRFQNPFQIPAVTPVKPPIQPTTSVRPTTPVRPTTVSMPAGFNLAALQQKFNPGVIRKASGGMLPTSKTEMNPMGGAPASTYGLASFVPEYQAAKGGYLDGPGDGMSDSIPATIEDKQPARLADGEFVIPADVVSGLGNGSSKAGAKILYAMMDRVRHARTGTKKQGKQIDPDKFLPA